MDFIVLERGIDISQFYSMASVNRFMYISLYGHLILLQVYFHGLIFFKFAIHDNPSFVILMLLNQTF